LIGAGETLQAKEGMLNTSLTIAPRQPAGDRQFWAMQAYNRAKHDLAPTRRARSLWLLAKKAATRVQSFVDPARPWLLHKLGRLELALLIRAEQAPNPDSRVMLAKERDALGMPKVRLDWRLSELDIHSVERLVAALGTEAERLGLGRVEPADWLSEPGRRWRTDPLVSAHAIAGYHHMGTTRMADDPKRGVTDPQGRLHGTDNLYIAGSSLFPTSGWANPTLTIAAFSLRTADHIAQQAHKRHATERAVSFA
jgi:choline dehydrogenase-like flavoprotein